MNTVYEIPLEAAMKVGAGMTLFITEQIINQYEKLPHNKHVQHLAESLETLENYMGHLVHIEKEAFNDPKGKMVLIELCVNTGEPEEELLWLIFAAKFVGIPNGTLMFPRRTALVGSTRSYKLYKSGLSLLPIQDVDILLERSINLHVERLKFGKHVAQA